MRLKYRNFLFVFALVMLNQATHGDIQSANLNLPEVDQVVEIDGEVISRRGLIAQIAQTLEGVVAITEDILNIILLPVKQLIKLDQEAILENPHREDGASVRIGGPLCLDELEFRSRRFPIVKAAQERFLAMELDDEDVLEIAFVGSGGGVRAKTCTLGSCVGADKIGLLDTVMCMSALSGSTWFLAPWVSSGLPLNEYKERAFQDIVQGLDLESAGDFGPMFDSFWVKFAYSQHLNIIDLYGALLGNNLLRRFGKEQHMIYLSEQQPNIADGIFPLPVYTSVLANINTPNHWFEFTPFEIGSRAFGAYVPSWAFGRSFKKGMSRSGAPEQSLGFLMGVFGSAFAASFEEMYEKSIKYLDLPKFLHGVPGASGIFEALKKLISKIALSTDVGEFRAAWAQVFNYMYRMRECELHDYQDLKMADAGVDFNNPIFASYRKPPHGGAPDVIFVFDASSTINMEEIQLAERYARLHDFAFPEIDTTDVETRALTVYGEDAGQEIPLVLYMPRVVDSALLAQYTNHSELGAYARQLKNFAIEQETDSGFASTFNFEYTRGQAKLLSCLTEFNIRALKEKLKELLRARVAAKRQARGTV